MTKTRSFTGLLVFYTACTCNPRNSVAVSVSSWLEENDDVLVGRGQWWGDVHDPIAPKALNAGIKATVLDKTATASQNDTPKTVSTHCTDGLSTDDCHFVCAVRR